MSNKYKIATPIKVPPNIIVIFLTLEGIYGLNNTYINIIDFLWFMRVFRPQPFLKLLYLL